MESQIGENSPARKRSDADHGNVSVPLEAADFMNRWIETREAQDLGIRSGRDLVITIYEIQIEKIKKFQAEPSENDSSYGFNVTIPRELSDELDRIAAESYITKALWLPHKTSMLSFALKGILSERNTKYNKLAELLMVTLDDIRNYKERKRKLARALGAGQG